MGFWLIYLSLLSATFEAVVEQTVLSTALPTIAADLHSTSPSWVANSLGLVSLGSIVGGTAKNMTTMVAGRGIQGADAGVIFAIVEIILPILSRSPSEACPLIGGTFTSFDYRWLFWINPITLLPIALGCMWVMKLRGPENNMREKLTKMEWIGNLVLIPSMSVVVLAIG
ncbi:major facilitator superfamily protein [Rhodotorula toruloides]|uniref:Major facilitator superfamily protein n=1 Tax=Rhodotorula toruloides TaxID=5286 RepID=A0A511KNZ5_RHOTO|nr:major facilitator superfamily protein [Rhodotorula toruloides]